MRAVVQRVTGCTVAVDRKVVGEIRSGLLVYLGVERDDDQTDVDYLAGKIINLRIFPDDEGKMNLSILDLDKELLVVSQFTLHADVRKGRRPSYNHAAPPREAEALYDAFLRRLESLGTRPERGLFGAHMEVSSTNSGPVTLLLDSRKLF